MVSRKSTSSGRVATEMPTRRAPAKAPVVAPGKPAPAKTLPPLPTQPAKAKQKLVRDSFTIPKDEYAVLTGLKQRAALLTHPAKKSELLRAGIAALNAMPDKAFVAALGAVPSLKTGRPKQS